MDINKDYNGFEAQLLKLCRAKLPRGLTFIDDGVDVSYKRAYVTRAQAEKRKELNWKEFEDELDYDGLLDEIRSSIVEKMSIVIKTLIIVPKDDDDGHIEHQSTSQRQVYLW